VALPTSFKRLGLNLDPQDTATIDLTLDDGDHYFSRAPGASMFTAAGAPSTPPGSVSPAETQDPDGYLVATWTDASGEVLSSVYDPIAPTIDTVSPPGDAVAGQPSTFTIQGSDVWGPVTYNIDFGDGQSANGRAIARPTGVLARVNGGGTVAHTYGSPGGFLATITVTDGAANSSTRQVPVAVGAAPATSAATPPAPLPPIPGLADPVLGVTANVFPVKQPVRIKQPGQKKFVLLTSPAQIRIGSVIDATKGVVRLTIQNAAGKLDTADFYGGVFQLLQRKTGSKLASLQLNGGRFKGCPRAPKAVLTRKRLSPKRSVRHLWGSGTGAFRTVGRFSSATVRGTKWLTDDRCNGTLTRVTKGKVAVFDFVKRKTIIVRAGHRYLALPKKS
jgi:hypothetical protein